MPSGKTHDAITIALAAPVLAAAFVATGDIWLATVVTVGFLFGGLMFGPDLDTTSKQYSRWKFLKLLWFPYRNFFKHRSRWSHGLVFGTLLRVIYFVGVLTVLMFAAAYAASGLMGRELPDAFAFVREWRTVGDFIRSEFGSEILPAVFAGMWIGAASHTLTDIAGTFIKTGRVGEFL